MPFYFVSASDGTNVVKVKSGGGGWGLGGGGGWVGGSLWTFKDQQDGVMQHWIPCNDNNGSSVTECIQGALSLSREP